MRESAVEGPAVALAKKEGWLVRKTGWIGRRGCPDRYFTKKGYTPRFIEFKAPGEPLKPHQVREIRRMREYGTVVFVVDNMRAFRAALEAKRVLP